MTVMLFQLDGSDQALQEGIRTISGAIQGMMRPARSLALLPASPATTEEPEIEAITGDEPESASNGQEELFEKKSESRRIVPKAPEVLHDLKVPVDGLKQFCESKKVGEKDSKRYLAIAVFLKEQMQITSVTADHIHTCYRLLGWNTPKDAGSPLRNLKSNGHFQKGEEAGAYILNHVGENAVRDMGKE